jgi:hypothetical protein
MNAFAYRCLALNVANGHGWEILCAVTFDHYGPAHGNVRHRVSGATRQPADARPGVQPRFLPIEADPVLASHPAAFERSRGAFLDEQNRNKADDATQERRLKRYFHGVDMTDQPVISDHRSRPRLEPFAPIEEQADPEADPMAPIVLQTDTATLVQVLGEIILAVRSGALDDEGAAPGVAKQMTTIGPGEAEATEVLTAALVWAEPDVPEEE